MSSASIWTSATCRISCPRRSSRGYERRRRVLVRLRRRPRRRLQLDVLDRVSAGPGRSSTVDGARLPRGPDAGDGRRRGLPDAASWQRYDDRTKGPYQAALPIPPADGPRPTLYALPGNHDWYDGLTSFLRLFAQARQRARRRLAQPAGPQLLRASELPQRWWLLAIDTQFGAYIDDPQLDYFHEVAAQLQPGDRSSCARRHRPGSRRLGRPARVRHDRLLRAYRARADRRRRQADALRRPAPLRALRAARTGS